MVMLDAGLTLHLLYYYTTGFQDALYCSFSRSMQSFMCNRSVGRQTCYCREQRQTNQAVRHISISYKNKHLVSSSLPGGDLQVVGVLIVRRKTGGEDGPKIGRLELVGLGEGRHGCLQEVTLGSGRSLGLGLGSVTVILNVKKGVGLL